MESSESDSVSHEVSNAEKINPQIIVSAIPVELVGKIDLSRCESPPHALAPYLNSRALLRLVPEPKGPDCKTESPLSAETIETIRLHGRKESAAPPGETDFVLIVSVAHIGGQTSVNFFEMCDKFTKFTLCKLFGILSKM